MRDEEVFEIDLLQIIKYSWDRKFLVVFITSIFLAAAIGISYLITPIFQSEAILAPVNRETTKSSLQSQLGGLAEIVGIGGAASTDESTVYLATFESRKFMREFIVENNLKPILYEEVWDSQTSQWKDEEPTLWDAVNKFDTDVRTISVNQETGLITLQVDWKDPEVSVNWSLLMIEKINRLLHKDFIAETEINLDYLNDQLSKTQNSDLRAVLYTLIQEQIQKSMLSASEINFAYRIIDPPVIPEQRISPRRTLFAIGGILIGGLLAVLYAWASGHRKSKS